MNIYKQLNIEEEHILKPKHGATPAMLAKDLFPLLLKGYSNKEIAKELSFSIRTLERWLPKIFASIGVKKAGTTTTWALSFQLHLGVRKCSRCGELKLIGEYFGREYSHCKECDSVRVSSYYKEHRTERSRYSKNHYKNNEAQYKHRNALRRARLLEATPCWVDESELQEVYENCPSGFEVDHIVPLQGKDVCGLHVPWNLQYLTPEENKKKFNKF